MSVHKPYFYNHEFIIYWSFYLQALFQKAELLFMEGEYETALAYYNKGFKQRPDIQAFQDGIFKSHDAMNRGLGSGNKNIQLTVWNPLLCQHNLCNNFVLDHLYFL